MGTSSRREISPIAEAPGSARSPVTAKAQQLINVIAGLEVLGPDQHATSVDSYLCWFSEWRLRVV
jgi:hypothetical protein